jgi:hypothetical protein
MIVIVAPYTGYLEHNVNLGASKKIKFVVSSFSKISSEIVLVNSAHNESVNSDFVVRKIQLGDVAVTEIILPTKRNKVFGKFSNLFDVPRLLDIIGKEGVPELFWLYNGYALEMAFAAQARKRFSAPMILEFEDWHFSRSRGLSIKPVMDFVFWRNVVKHFSRVYAINSNVKSKVEPFCKDVFLLPGVVSKALIDLQHVHLPFSDKGAPIHIGYFGGLSVEKGADIVLKLSALLPAGYILHSTGSGALSKDFALRSAESDGGFIYHGMVSDERLNEIISKCDVILNPHTPIAEFEDGIFPFKVIEAIASGRLLISTKLSFKGFEGISRGVQFVEHSPEAFKEAILKSGDVYEANKDAVQSSTLKSQELFGEYSFVKSLKQFVQRTGMTTVV